MSRSGRPWSFGSLATAVVRWCRARQERHRCRGMSGCIRQRDGRVLLSSRVTELPRWIEIIGEEAGVSSVPVAGPPGPSCATGSLRSPSQATQPATRGLVQNRVVRSEPRDRRLPFPRNEGRSVFGPVATSYEDARPDYPDRVFEILRERCGLGPSTRVVEIGAGSGKATRRLLEAGAHVVAVEPSPPLAEELRARFLRGRRLDIVGAAFEDADLSPSSFDLVVAATAFHWLDPGPTLPKIVSILRPGGWLALWWNVFGDPGLPDPFHDATEQILNDLEPSPSEGARRTAVRPRRRARGPRNSRARGSRTSRTRRFDGR